MALVALVVGSSGGGSTGDKQSFTDEQKSNMIGKIIMGYKPSFNATADVQAGTIAEGKYTPKDEYTGRESSDTEQGAFDTESLVWRIWGIDENNIYLISKDPTTTKLTLKGAQGYNNGVYILNETCKTCYTDSDYTGVSVRNMNIRDIEELYDRGIMTYDYTLWSWKYNTEITNTYDTTPYEYNFSWPTQWFEHDKDDTKPFKKRSEQSELIQSGTATQEWSDLRPRLTYWGFGEYGDEWIKNFTDKEEGLAYKSMILFDYNVGVTNQYWMSSRAACPQQPIIVGFGLFNVDSHGLGVGTTYNSWSRKAEESVLTRGVRPLVSVPLTSCTISGPNEQEEYTIKAK